jgi:hypothetical protein
MKWMDGKMMSKMCGERVMCDEKSLDRSRLNLNIDRAKFSSFSKNEEPKVKEQSKSLFRFCCRAVQSSSSHIS